MSICLPWEPRSAPRNQRMAAKRPSRVSEVLTQWKGGSMFWGCLSTWHAAWPCWTERLSEAQGASLRPRVRRPAALDAHGGSREGPLPRAARHGRGCVRAGQSPGPPSPPWLFGPWAWVIGAEGSCSFLEVFGSQRVRFGWFARDRLTGRWVVYCL